MTDETVTDEEVEVLRRAYRGHSDMYLVLDSLADARRQLADARLRPATCAECPGMLDRLNDANEHAIDALREVEELKRQLTEARREGEAAGRDAAFTETLEHVRRESKAHTDGDNEGGALALDILANWLVEKVGAGEESGR